MDKLPAHRRKKIEERARVLIAEEMTLRDLRKAFAQTQKSVARKLTIGQDAVSRLEQRSDLLLSTLQSYVAALGGSLELVARFPDRPPVTLSGLGLLSDEEPSRPRLAAARAKRAPRKAARRAKRLRRAATPQ
jgi:transcriptional regulator with XRE-family HTH domain